MEIGRYQNTGAIPWHQNADSSEAKAIAEQVLVTSSDYIGGVHQMEMGCQIVNREWCLHIPISHANKNAALGRLATVMCLLHFALPSLHVLLHNWVTQTEKHNQVLGRMWEKPGAP